MSLTQPDLFSAAAPKGPEGFRYAPDFLGADEEWRLVDAFAALPFTPFEFHGYLGKRRVVWFGYRYDYGQQALVAASPMPDYLAPLRDRAADFAGLPREEFTQVLVTEYEPGAGIGWHRDKPMFDEVVGVSLKSPCTLRFRRRTAEGFERISVMPQPRSVYLLQGPARTVWEHSIPGVEDRRYSVTFRRYTRGLQQRHGIQGTFVPQTG